MVFKYALRGYMLRISCYAVRSTQYVLLCDMCYVWISLYDSPPLVTFEGRLACRKWFGFLELKIKKGCGFGFRYGIFSGKGNKG